MENIEYSYLDPFASIGAIEIFCEEAKAKQVKSIAVSPLFVKKANELLQDSPTKVSTVISFPFGWSVIESKLAEIILAMVDGADELDVVINMTALKNNDWQYLAKELNTLLAVVRKQQKFLNIVVESEWLDAADITRCCDLYGAAGIDCLSLSTGLQECLPSPEMVGAVRNQLADAVAIKITGRSLDQAAIDLYRQFGATRVSLLVK